MIKNQTNGTISYDNYKGKFLFNMNYSVSFVTDSQLMYFMSTRCLKDKINGVRVPQFKVAYIFDTTHP